MKVLTLPIRNAIQQLPVVEQAAIVETTATVPPIVRLPVEVLECIFLYSSLKGLVCLSGVCHTWQRTIHSSPLLQQKLFLRPNTDKPKYIIWQDVSPDTPHQRWGNLLTLPFLVDKPGGESNRPVRQVVEVHPVLATRDVISPRAGIILLSGPERIARVLGQRGPWSAAYITQPPMSHFEIDMRMTCAKAGKLIRHLRTVVSEDGVTFRHVIDEIHLALRKADHWFHTGGHYHGDECGSFGVEDEWGPYTGCHMQIGGRAITRSRGSVVTNVRCMRPR